MKRKIHIGMVGCGNWGKNILRDLMSLGCTVTVVARSVDSKKRASDFGDAKIVEAIKELGTQDGFVVVTPSATHGEVINKLITLFPTKPIFTEKPLTTDLKSAVELVKKSPDSIFVMDKWRYHSGVSELARIAKNKTLGQVIGLKTTRVGWGNPHKDSDAIWHLLPHDISIGLEIFGKILDPVKAVVDLENGFPTGMIAFLGGNPWQITEVSSRYKDKKREMRLFCEKGTAVLDDAYTDHIRIVTADKKNHNSHVKKIPIDNKLPLYEELNSFIKFIKKIGPPPKSSAKEGMVIVKVISELRTLAGI